MIKHKFTEVQPKPVFETYKTLYPLNDIEGNKSGCIIVTMRVGCYGSCIVQKLRINNNEDPKTAFVCLEKDGEQEFIRCEKVKSIANCAEQPKTINILSDEEFEIGKVVNDDKNSPPPPSIVGKYLWTIPQGMVCVFFSNC